jgi:hypothetical protein
MTELRKQGITTGTDAPTIEPRELHGALGAGRRMKLLRIVAYRAYV